MGYYKKVSQMTVFFLVLSNNYSYSGVYTTNSVNIRKNSVRYLQLNPNREVTIYLKKFEQEQFDIDDRRCEIHREIDELEREDTNLTEHFNKLESIIDKCQRALAGEPIFIWVEIQRFEWELENMRQQILSLNLD